MFKSPFHFRTTNSELSFKTYTYFCLRAYGICIYIWILIFQEIDEADSSQHLRDGNTHTLQLLFSKWVSGDPFHMGQSTQPQAHSEGQMFNPLYCFAHGWDQKWMDASTLGDRCVTGSLLRVRATSPVLILLCPCGVYSRGLKSTLQYLLTSRRCEPEMSRE